MATTNEAVKLANETPEAAPAKRGWVILATLYSSAQPLYYYERGPGGNLFGYDPDHAGTFESRRAAEKVAGTLHVRAWQVICI